MTRVGTSIFLRSSVKSVSEKALTLSELGDTFLQIALRVNPGPEVTGSRSTR
jgi:hypothetical protein